MEIATIKKMYKTDHPRKSSTGRIIKTPKTILTTSEDETSQRRSKACNTLQKSIQELQLLAGSISQEKSKSQPKYKNLQKTLIDTTNSTSDKDVPGPL